MLAEVQQRTKGDDVIGVDGSRQLNEVPTHFIHEIKKKEYDIIGVNVFLHKSNRVGHFTVVCSVPWPLNRSEDFGDFVLLETFLFFICK